MTCEICILAGGLSRRMGQDKARLKLGSRTMLGHIRHQARKTALPVRILRRDLVLRCGPLGGIYTALRSTTFSSVLFLACDMPLISPELLALVLAEYRLGESLFTRSSKRAIGFPLILSPSALAVVERQIERKELALHALAKALGARIYEPEARFRTQLANVNTPEQWDRMKRAWPRIC